MTTFNRLAPALVLGLAAGSVGAQEASTEIDVNGDGFYSFPEISTVFTQIDNAAFSAMDTTGDGLLDMAEVAAAQASGLMPQT